MELLGTGAFRADSILRIYSLSKKVEDQNPNLISTNDGIVCIWSVIIRICILFPFHFTVNPKDFLNLVFHQKRNCWRKM
jgi:hypothetical protein